MKFSDYINDNKKILLICLAGGLLFSVLLFFFGLGTSELLLLWLCFAGIFFFTIWTDYLGKQKRIRSLLSTLDSLDQKYLLAEIADKPETELEKVYFRLLKTALKDMTDEIADSRRINTEYRDYIEQWIHEIKVPITGIELICENHKTDVTRKIKTQTELIEQEVEKVLFYARLGSVEKDYLIKEISLKDCVLEVLARNKQFLIQNNVCVHTDSVTDTVYSDQKWICFILNQIIINSIKYRSDQPPVIQIASHNTENYVSLSVTDNGIGIKPSEISRVFDKGFVGSNGRGGANATGIGLYLCKQLCAKLGIGIDIESETGKSTTVLLYFPKSDHLKI
ncbi:MAG: HAMP domain-containing histidine kinase [Lachnospiraceae bacterium]|nr:HAMP domain-containing histidine kinase [Lachnospiraceae bacterium]